METRVVKFNLKNFLSDLRLLEEENLNNNVLSDFLEFYNNSSLEIRKQSMRYLKESKIYKKDPVIANKIDNCVDFSLK